MRSAKSLFEDNTEPHDLKKLVADFLKRFDQLSGKVY